MLRNSSIHYVSVRRYADVMKQDVLRQAVLRVIQSITGALAAAAAQDPAAAGASQPISKLVLPTLAILLEWWAVNPACST